MTTKKRDQRQYDLVQQYLSGLMLNTVLGIIKNLGDPYAVRPGLGGMTAYPPGAMAAVCIMLEAQRTTYRKMVGILRNNSAMAAKMGLEKIPSKSTIARAYGLIPEWYLAEAHRIAIREVEADSWQQTVPDTRTCGLSGGLTSGPTVFVPERDGSNCTQSWISAPG